MQPILIPVLTSWQPPRVATGKATKMFYENMKVLLFKDEEYKWSVFKNNNIDKNLRVFM
jgi:hypothetical protein